MNQLPRLSERYAKVDQEGLTQWSSRRRKAVTYFIGWLTFATLAFLAAQSWGQAPAAPPAAPAPAGAHKSEKLDPALLEKTTASAMEQARKEGISKRDMTPQWQRFPAFEAYYKRLVFGKLKDDAYLSELGSITQSLLEDLDRANKSGAPAAGLIRGYIIDMAKQIAPDNYHPAARINATLLLALVDDAPEDARNRKPPVPSAAALVPLVQLYNKPTNPDGVRAAALQGIARHVALGAVKNPQYRAGIAKMMIDLSKSEAPAGRSPAAHAYMQRYALDVLAVLANPNASPDTTKTLVTLSTDAKAPTLISAYAASKIGGIQAGKATVDQVPEVLKNWAARAADTIDGELKRIASLDPPVPVMDQPAMPTADTPMAGGRGGSSSYGEEGGRYGSSMSGGSAPGMSDPTMNSSYESSMSSGYGGMDGMMMPGMPGMAGMAAPVNPQPLEVITARRRINHVLQQLQQGVTGQPTTGVPTRPAGLLAVATAPEKPAVDKWITTVGEVVTAINVNTLDDRKKFVEELTKQSEVLRKLSGVNPKPAVPGQPAGPGIPGQPGAPRGFDPSDPFAGMQPGAPAAPGIAAPAPGIAAPAPGVAAPVPGGPVPAALPPANAPVQPARGVQPAAAGAVQPATAIMELGAAQPVAPAAQPVAPAAQPAVPPAVVEAPIGPGDAMDDL